MITDKEWLLDVNIAYEKGKLKGRADAIDEIAELADCDDADCFDCAFYSGTEGCKLHSIILKEYNNE